MPSNKIPDRWEDYETIGKPIGGTRFITFKVPLKQQLCATLPCEKHFTPNSLLKNLDEDGKKLGIVIDLTNTARYYDPNVFCDAGVEYQKIFTEGKVVPSEDVKMRFLSVIDDFIERNPADDRLIGVHCTHGVNRTGHLVCRYMIDRLNIKPETAIKSYNEARGHNMERENYIEDLKTCPTDMAKYENFKSINKVTPWVQRKITTSSEGASHRLQHTGYSDRHGWNNPHHNHSQYTRDFRYVPRGGNYRGWERNARTDRDYGNTSQDYRNKGRYYENMDRSNWGGSSDNDSRRTFGRNDYWEQKASNESQRCDRNNWGSYSSRQHDFDSRESGYSNRFRGQQRSQPYRGSRDFDSQRSFP